MIKSELVRRIAARNPHLHHHDVEIRVNAIFTAIAEALARGHRVELRGFGSFSVRQRQARQGRNPRNGAPVAVEGKVVPMFRSGRAMHARLQDRPLSKAERSAGKAT